MIGNYLLMMFYTTVCGWMLHYFYLTASGKFVGATTEEVGAAFPEMLSQPLVMIGWMVVVVVVGFAINSFGLQGGLERVTKVMMIALLAIMVILAINSVTTEGAEEGLKFYLIPDLKPHDGIWPDQCDRWRDEQSFFTLSLGIGAMAIFGSYVGKSRALMGEAVNVAILDTFVAFTAGLIIFPSMLCVWRFSGQRSEPEFLSRCRIFSIIWRLVVCGAACSLYSWRLQRFQPVLAVFENIMSCCMDLTGWSRKKVALFNTVLIILLSCRVCWGYNVWSGFQPFGEGSAVLDLEDFLVSNIWLPLGSLVYLLFCTTRYGWGWKNFKEEANEGGGLKVRGRHPVLCQLYFAADRTRHFCAWHKR